METELEKSQYQSLPHEVLTSAAKVLDEAPRNSKYGVSEEFEGMGNKILSRLYEWLDSLSGRESLTFHSPEGALREPFEKIIADLEKREYVKESIFRTFRYNDAPMFHRLDIVAAYPRGSTEGRIPDRTFSHGFGKNREMVMAQAIGEFLERYFLSLYHKKNLLRGSCAALQGKRYQMLNPELLAGFSDEQKKINPHYRWDEKSVFYWERAERVLTREKVLIPAQLAHWNYILDDEEPLLQETNTNGAGGMYTREGAILSGLYELIQRDALLIFWLNSLAPPKICPETVPSTDFQNLLEESRRYGFRVHCLNVTTDTGIPSFIVFLEDGTKHWPRLSIGAGCSADPERALYRALVEAWSIYDWLRPFTPYRLKESYQPFRDSAIGQRERTLLLANPELTEKYYSFFLAGEEKAFSEHTFNNFPVAFPTEKDELRYLIKRIENLGPGYEIYAYEAKHPFLKTIGYAATQVIVPHLIPLYLNEAHAHIGARRLREVPEKLGYRAAENFNPIPQPFP